LGEYNHLLSLFLCCRLFQLQVHCLTTLAFLILGGVLAGWNHTRFDIVFSLFGITIFDSKLHDVHHRIPQSNYGQYTMFWDSIFGTYR
jgi:sterol desaturase/sphingolipid hydroxylase (fatty acid hydroxylase superfamily)